MTDRELRHTEITIAGRTMTLHEYWQQHSPVFHMEMEAYYGVPPSLTAARSYLGANSRDPLFGGRVVAWLKQAQQRQRSANHRAAQRPPETR